MVRKSRLPVVYAFLLKKCIYLCLKAYALSEQLSCKYLPLGALVTITYLRAIFKTTLNGIT